MGNRPVAGTSGEFALVLVAVTFDTALLSEELFQQLLVVVLSMLTTPPLAALAYRLVTTHWCADTT